ncbi:hypothetical protein Tco_1384930 [Tanacetum coccineum]
MATEPNEVRRSTLRRLQEDIAADDALAINLLDVLTRYIEQMRSRGPEMLRVESLPDIPLSVTQSNMEREVTPDHIERVHGEKEQGRNEVSIEEREEEKTEVNRVVDSDFSYKEFAACKPFEFHGEQDPLICFRWLLNVEGAFIIMEYLVNISKRRAFWSLNEDILKITILTTNTPYPSRKIRHIRACTNERPQRKEDQYAANTFRFTRRRYIYEWNAYIPWVYDKPWLDNGIWKEPKLVKHTCKPFNYKTGCSEWPTCSWREDGYYNGGNLPRAYHIGNSLHYQDLEWYEALKDSELKDEALRNKAIMEGMICDDESSNDYWKRWKSHEINYHNYDEREYKTKLMMKDMSYVVSKLARCRFAK